MNTQEALFQYVLRLGDDSLILGHRLSEWCGHGPVLEEDIATINISCLLYTSPSPRDRQKSRMPSSA